MKHIFLSLSFLTLFSLITHANIIYVNASATGNNDGSSWTDAYTDLNFMKTATAAGDSIFVAQGVYKPATGGLYETNVSVNLYGGFPATGNPTWSSRDWVANPTICDGDNNGDDASYLYTDNAKRLFYFGAESTLDGFTIQNGGHAGGASCAGIWITRGGTIKNCTFLRNKCLTSGLSLTAVGGAILAQSPSSVESDTLFIENCVFRNNAAQTGGAISSEMNTVIQNSRFGENIALNGPAIGMVSLPDDTRDDIVLDLEQNVFYKNGTASMKPAIYLVTTRNGADGSTIALDLSFCTFTKEFAIANLILNNPSNNFNFMSIQSGNNLVELENSNQTVDLFSVDFNDPNTAQVITYGATGRNQSNIAGANPFFDVNTPVWATYDTVALDFIMDCASPNIDSAGTSTMSEDIAGNPRLDGPGCDIGAFESQCNTIPNAVQDLKRNPQLNIFPNPTTAYLKLSMDKEEIKHIEVYDVMGKRIKSFQPNQSIEVGALPNGMYVLLVETADGIAYSRFVKE